MKEFFKKLFCKHNYEKVSCRIHRDILGHEIYTEKLYRCKKCGKQVVELEA